MLKAPSTAVALLAVSATLTTSVPASADLAAAVLPSSRSTQVDNTVTVFTTVINAGSETATGCSIENQSGLPIALAYQTTDPATNLPTGTVNTPVDIAPGQSQSFVLSLTPTAIIDSVPVPFTFSCASGTTASTINGGNTLLLSSSDTPVIDVIALAVTGGNTGALSHDDSAGAFSLATVNIGAPDTVTVAADTGAADLPVTLSVCETNPNTGACLESPAASVDVTMSTGATPTFSVFSQASAEVANNPAINRVFVRFTDSQAVVRGATSVALANELPDVPKFSQSTLEVLRQVFAFTFGATQGVSSNSGRVSSAGIVPLIEVPINDTVACEMTGQVTVSGTSDVDQNGGSSSITMDFQNCDGINGLLTVENNVALSGTLVSFDTTQNGSYSAEECEEITMSDVQIRGEFNIADPIEDIFASNPFTTSGTISGRCNGEAFSCSLDGVDLQDDDALIENCSD